MRLLILSAMFFALSIQAQTPSVLYLAEMAGAVSKLTLGAIEPFGSGKQRIIIDNAEKNVAGDNSVVGAEVVLEPKSGKFAVFVTAKGFEQFTFASKQNHIVMGDVKSGLTSFFSADKLCQEEKMKCFESPLKFSNDGKKIFSIALFSNHSAIHCYDIETKSLTKDIGGKPKGKETRNVVLSDDEAYVATTMNGDKNIYLKRIGEKGLPASIFTASEQVQLIFLNGENLIYAKTIDGGVYKNDQSGNFRELCVLNLKTKEEKSIFKFDATHAVIPSRMAIRHSIAFDRKYNRLYFVVSKKNFKETGDLYRMELTTFETTKIATDVDDVFDMSSDGKFVLGLTRIGNYLDEPTGKVLRVLNVEDKTTQSFTMPNCSKVIMLGFYE